MKNADDIENYLVKTGMPYESIGPEMWNIKADYENLVLSIAGPVLVFRAKLMEVPHKQREALFETLLRLNASDMVHGAFGLEGENSSSAVVITCALELENLDLNEFQAVVDDITLAVTNHYPKLKQFVERS